MRILTEDQVNMLWEDLQSCDVGQKVGLLNATSQDGPIYGEDFPAISGDDFTREQLAILCKMEVIFALGELGEE